MKVELISQDNQWLFATCPMCGNEISKRPNPAHEMALRRRKALDTIAFRIIMTAVVVLSLILLVEVIKR